MKPPGAYKNGDSESLTIEIALDPAVAETLAQVARNLGEANRLLQANVEVLSELLKGAPEVVQSLLDVS